MSVLLPLGALVAGELLSFVIAYRVFELRERQRRRRTRVAVRRQAEAAAEAAFVAELRGERHLRVQPRVVRLPKGTRR